MAKQKNIGFYCGTSNVELPVANKSHYPVEYRDKSRLHYYATLFNTVEINSSFYKIPMQRTVERWAADVPGDFKFTFKLWKGITHAKGFDYNAEDVGKFVDTINGIGTKRGCLLVQLPASIKYVHFQQLKNLLGDLRSKGAAEWRLAIEFRDVSWYNKDVYKMLAGYEAAIVIHDMPKSATPVLPVKTDFVYLRYHGEKGDYRGGYTDSRLKQQCELIRKYEEKGKTIFAYFNNTLGDAVANALTLQKMIAGKAGHPE